MPKEYQIVKQRMKDLLPGQAYPNITTAEGWRLHSLVPAKSALEMQGFTDYLMIMERDAEAPAASPVPVKLNG